MHILANFVGHIPVFLVVVRYAVIIVVVVHEFAEKCLQSLIYWSQHRGFVNCSSLIILLCFMETLTF